MNKKLETQINKEIRWIRIIGISVGVGFILGVILYCIIHRPLG